jgi:hypothetical protein
MGLISGCQNNWLAALDKVSGDPGPDVSGSNNCSCHVNLQMMMMEGLS